MNRYILSTHGAIPAVVDTQDSNELVFYINDIKPDVIVNCLNIFNKVQDIRQVNEYLLDEDDCEEDQRDFIIEQLGQYAELAYRTVETTPTMEENKVIETTAAMTIPGSVSEPGSPAPIKEEFGKYKEAYDGLRDSLQADLGSVIITKSSTTGVETAPTAEKTKRQWARRITDGNPAIKAQSAADFIKVMQEKIEMAKMLDGIELPEIPTSMTKANRDVMIEFQKEHSQLLVKYMQKIQQA
jgi:hypothetical protein